MESTSCAVCGDRHHGHHFGVLACRACSSFWRRSLVERKVYKCSSNNNCDIGTTELKNSCRSCRLKRCKEAGMKGEIHIVQEPIRQYMSPHIQKLETNELRRYQVNYRNFCSAQKSLFVIENPKAIFSTPEFKPLKMMEHQRMDRGSISLLHMFISDCCEPYKALSKEVKLSVIRNFFFQFVYLHRCYMTSNYYPTMEDPHVCVHFGYYISKQTLREFFEGLTDIEEQIKFCSPLIDIFLKSVNRFREIRLREIELVALMAISLHNIILDLNIINPQLITTLDAINNELLCDVINYYGADNCGIRIGRLHSLLHHTKAIEMRENMIVARIFLVNMIPDAWSDLEIIDVKT